VQTGTILSVLVLSDTTNGKMNSCHQEGTEGIDFSHAALADNSD